MSYRWSAFALALLACGSKDADPSTSKRALPKDAAVEIRSPVSLGVQHFDEPAVKLPLRKAFTVESRGANPTSLLRYDLSPRTASYVTLTKLASRRLAGGQWGAKTTLPAIRNGLSLTTAKAGTPLVGRGLAGEVVGESTPEAVEYLAGWKALEDRPFTVELDARGQLGAVTFRDDPSNSRSMDATAELTQRLLATLIPFPEEPVGVGAVWRVVTVLRQRPAIVKQTATYKLLARTATTWKIDVDIRRIAEQQTLIEPTIPEDTVIDLLALIRTMHGTLDGGPGELLATGTLDISSSLHLRINQKSRGLSEEITEDEGSIVLSTSR